MFEFVVQMNALFIGESEGAAEKFHLFVGDPFVFVLQLLITSTTGNVDWVRAVNLVVGIVEKILQEEQACGFVNIQLDGASVDLRLILRLIDGLIEEFDEHGQVVGEDWVEPLLVTHNVVIEHITGVLVE